MSDDGATPRAAQGRRAAYSRALAFGIVAVLGFAACSSSDVTSVPSTTIEDVGDVSIPPGSEPRPSPETTVSRLNPEVEVERLSQNGVTLLLPSSVFEVLPMDDAQAGDDTVARLSGIVAPVGEGSISVVTILDRNGDLSAGLSAADREWVEVLTGSSVPDQAGARIDFVNGAGVRRFTDSSYSFTGLTADGRQLVAVEIDTDGVDQALVDVVDDMVGSLYVGPGASASPVACRTAVDVVGEVVLEPAGPVSAGELVTATWPVVNQGECTWTPADAWVVSGGDAIPIVRIGDVAGVAPGAEATASVTFMAPASGGSYVFQMQFLPDGGRDLVAPVVLISFTVAGDR